MEKTTTANIEVVAYSSTQAAVNIAKETALKLRECFNKIGRISPELLYSLKKCKERIRECNLCNDAELLEIIGLFDEIEMRRGRNLYTKESIDLILEKTTK